MKLVELLDKHFPKEDLAAVELFPRKDTDGKLMIYLATRFDFMREGRAKGTYDLWQHGDGDYPSMRVSQYTMLAVYDVSDLAKVRAFMLDSVVHATDEELRNGLGEMFCCG